MPDARVRQAHSTNAPSSVDDVRGLDRHRAALRHRVARVHGEVDDHLLDLRRVGAHRARARAEHRDELDVLADQPAQHHVHVADRRVQVEDPRLQHLPAAEREQLARERGRAVGRPLDLLGVPAQLRVGRAADQELAVPGDRREQVVEVVRDAAGEPADRFHLLRLAQLRLDARHARSRCRTSPRPARRASGNALTEKMPGAIRRRRTRSRRRRAPRPVSTTCSRRFDHPGVNAREAPPRAGGRRRPRSEPGRRPRSPGSRTAAAAIVASSANRRRARSACARRPGPAAAARSSELAALVSISFVLRITAPMNSAISRAVSTPSSSNACGSRAETERTPTTVPSRWSGAQISDRAAEARDARRRFAGRSTCRPRTSPRRSATRALRGSPSGRAVGRRDRAAIPEQWWYTDSCPSNHCTAAPSPPQSRCARKTIVLVIASWSSSSAAICCWVCDDRVQPSEVRAQAVSRCAAARDALPQDVELRPRIGHAISPSRSAVATACVRVPAPRREQALRRWVRTVSGPIPSCRPISS